jgi:hypothetical protein
LKYNIVPPTNSGTPGGDDLRHLRQRIAAKIRRGISLCRIKNIQQPVRRSALLRGIGLAVPISIPR